MTRSRYCIAENPCPYFLTCTVVAWLPVFTRKETVDILLDSWRYLQTNQRLTLYGYVILENHLHLIASAADLSKEIGDFKSFTARRIIDCLRERRAKTLLHLLEWFKAKHKVGQRYQLWQEGSHPQQISGDDVMEQILAYMHNNPVERGYVDEPTHWRYSSARNYEGMPGLIDVVTDWR
jgi:REP element-mobilizing transposase RayT